MKVTGALGVLSVVSCLASCASPLEKRRSTERLLKELRPEVASLIENLGEEEDADGIPLLRHEGRLINRHLLAADEEKSVLRASTHALDAWGNPILVLQDLEHPGDWCLISAGPDGVWTSDGELARATYRGDRDELCERPPHYRGRAVAGSLRVVGDDVVLHASGEIARRYPHPIPKPATVVAWFLAALRRQPSIHFELGAELRGEIEALGPGDRDRIVAVVEHRAGTAFLSEDTWGREDRRKDGFLPRLYLCHEQPPAGASIWIEPGRAAWALDASLDELLEAAETPRDAGDSPSRGH